MEKLVDSRSVLDTVCASLCGSLVDRLKWLTRTMKQITQAVAVMHRRGVGHGDLSPKNVLFRPVPRQQQSFSSGGIFSTEDDLDDDLNLFDGDMYETVDIRRVEAVLGDMDECRKLGSSRYVSTPGYTESATGVVDAPSEVYGLAMTFAALLLILLTGNSRLDIFARVMPCRDGEDAAYVREAVDRITNAAEDRNILLSTALSKAPISAASKWMHAFLRLFRKMTQSNRKGRPSVDEVLLSLRVMSAAIMRP
jgi:serine/threonine protein kinase